MKKWMNAVGLVGLSLVAGNVLAGDVSNHRSDRALAGEKDFSKEYLEKITDERGLEEDRREELRKEHDRYMRSMGRQK